MSSVRSRVRALLLASLAALLAAVGVPLAAAPAGAAMTGVVLSGTSLGFGSVVMGTTRVLSIDVQNNTGANLGVGVSTPPAAGPFSDVSTSQPGTPCAFPGTPIQVRVLGPGDHCTISFQVAPAAGQAALSGTATLTSYDASAEAAGGYVSTTSRSPQGTQAITLKATATAPTYTASPATVAYGSTTVAGEKILTSTITNTTPNTMIGVSAPTVTPGTAPFLPVATPEPGAASCDGGQSGGGYVYVLNEGSSCQLAWAFRPTSTGAKTGTAQLNVFTLPPEALPDTTIHPDGAEVTGTIKLSGTGAVPTIAVTPAAPVFGTVAVGGHADQPVQVQNTSQVPLAVRTAPGTAPFTRTYDHFVTGACDDGGAYAWVILPGESCTTWLRFSPTVKGAKKGTMALSLYAMPGWSSGSQIHLPSESVDAATTLAVSGTGNVALLQIDDAAPDFGPTTVGAHLERTLEVTNTSATTLGLRPLAVTPAGPLHGVDDYATGSCTSSSFGEPYVYAVAAGQSCRITYAYDPTAVGASAATGTVEAYVLQDTTPGSSSYVAGQAPSATATVSLKGSGTALTVGSTVVDFGPVTIGSSEVQRTVVQNTSDLPIGVDFVGITTAASPFTLSDPTACEPYEGTSSVIEPNGACAIYFRYSPTVTTAKTAVGSLRLVPALGRVGGDQISNSGQAGGTATVSIKGSGKLATVTLSATTVALGTTTVGGYQTGTVTVGNPSDTPLGFRFAVPAGVVTERYDGTSCEISAGYLTTIPPGGTCTQRFTFRPIAAGAKSVTVPVQVFVAPDGYSYFIPEADEVPDAKASLKVTGTGKLPTVTFTPTSLAFGSTVVGATKVLSTQVRNTSNAPVAVLPAGYTKTGSPFAPVSTGTTDTCYYDGFSLALIMAPQATCQLAYRYAPQAVASHSFYALIDLYTLQDGTPGNVYISGEQPDDQVYITVKGSGAAAKPTVSLATIAFGTQAVGTTTASGVLVTNTSDVNMGFALTPITPAGAFAPAASGSQCEGGYGPGTQYVLVLAPGASCEARFQFAPTVKGAKTATARIDAYVMQDQGAGGVAYRAGRVAAGSVNVKLSGTGA